MSANTNVTNSNQRVFFYKVTLADSVFVIWVGTASSTVHPA